MTALKNGFVPQERVFCTDYSVYFASKLMFSQRNIFPMIASSFAHVKVLFLFVFEIFLIFVSEAHLSTLSIS